MSDPILTIEPDGTLRYDCGADVVVRVQLHRRNGTKKCPVELLYQNVPVVSTDSNLRELRDIQSLLQHANSRSKGAPIDWHDVLMSVARDLPEKAAPGDVHATLVRADNVHEEPI